MRPMWSLLLLGGLVAVALGQDDPSSNPDLGPEDPEFVANAGELESDVVPQQKPKGNYHIIQDKGVYVLNRDTFAHFVMDKDVVLVEFYAPWCGHCKVKRLQRRPPEGIEMILALIHYFLYSLYVNLKIL